MKNEITFEDYQKVQISVGTVLKVSKNIKARKPSLVLEVDFGPKIGIKKSSAQITHYYNANRLSELTLGVFAFAISSAGFPELSRHTASEDWPKIRKTMGFTMSNTLLLVMPASLGLF